MLIFALLFETNFFGPLRLMGAVLPLMRQQGSGHIVNMSSTAGLVGFEGSSLYCGAKFALEGTSEALAKEIEPFGIKVTLIEPGAFRTDRSEEHTSELQSRQYLVCRLLLEKKNEH